MSDDSSTAPDSPAPDSTSTSTDAVLEAWWEELSSALGLGPIAIDRDTLLALAGQAAHGVVRPAAPLTTFLAGFAAAREGGDAAALERAVATAEEAIRRRTVRS